jgi:hypothetical protein
MQGKQHKELFQVLFQDHITRGAIDPYLQGELWFISFQLVKVKDIKNDVVFYGHSWHL